MNVYYTAQMSILSNIVFYVKAIFKSFTTNCSDSDNCTDLQHTVFKMEVPHNKDILAYNRSPFDSDHLFIYINEIEA